MKIQAAKLPEESTLLTAPDAPEEGVTATAEPNGGEVVEGGFSGFSEDLPAWPDEAAESAFLAEQTPQPVLSAAVLPAEAPAKVEEIPVALPSLDSLVGRIPTEAREILEELFRAQFVSVRKIPKRALKK